MSDPKHKNILTGPSVDDSVVAQSEFEQPCEFTTKELSFPRVLPENHPDLAQDPLLVLRVDLLQIVTDG